jgi:hypothetical protein
VQLDQLLDERQPDPKSFLRALVGPIDLGKQIEDPGLHLGRDADARIGDLDADLILLAPRGETNFSARRRVFGGVGEEIADDLRKPGMIGLQPDRLRRDILISSWLAASM